MHYWNIQPNPDGTLCQGQYDVLVRMAEGFGERGEIGHLLGLRDRFGKLNCPRSRTLYEKCMRLEEHLLTVYCC